MKKENPYLQVPSIPDDEQLSLTDFHGSSYKRIELEVGFGKGHFLLQRAAAVPETLLLGIETRRKWVHLVQSRIQKHDVENALVYYGNARDAFRRFAPDASVERIFINFPDPWWKARHEKRMVICPELLDDAARLLKDGGELFVQTDVDFRAEKYQSILSSCDLIVPSSSDGYVTENRFHAQSLREKKCIETGLPVYRLLYTRINR